MIGMPPLDLDLDLPIPSAETREEWFTPYTSQLEKGEWDWEKRGSAWCGFESNASGSASGERELEDGQEKQESRKDL